MYVIQPTSSGSTVMNLPPIPIALQVISSVLLKDKVYITGIAPEDANELSQSRQVQVYSLAGRKWSTLPEAPVVKPAPNYNAPIAVIDNHITLIGGRDAETENVTNTLYTWLEIEHEWKQILPPMPTRRLASGVCQHDNLLLVTGGVVESTEGKKVVNSVDVYDLSTRSWYLRSYKALELPKPLRSHHVVVFEEYVYLAAGATRFPASHDEKDLFNHQAWRARWSDIQEVIKQPSDTEKSVWTQITAPPFLRPTIVLCKNFLISVGGMKDNTTQRTIFEFVKGDNDWIEVGKMSVGKFRHAVVPVGGRGAALFIAGGYVEGQGKGDEDAKMLTKKSSSVEVVLL